MTEEETEKGKKTPKISTHYQYRLGRRKGKGGDRNPVASKPFAQTKKKEIPW